MQSRAKEAVNELKRRKNHRDTEAQRTPQKILVVAAFSVPPCLCGSYPLWQFRFIHTFYAAVRLHELRSRVVYKVWPERFTSNRVELEERLIAFLNSDMFLTGSRLTS